MSKNLAKLKFEANSFKILEEGDHVICAVSGKKIPIDKLIYWNVELQEAYFGPKEAQIKHEQILKKK